MNPQDLLQFQQLVHKLNPHYTLLHAWELKGGVSARVTALEVERPDGQTTRMIARQHGAVDLQSNPHIAADEFRLLEALHSAGLPVPEPYYVDRSSEVFTSPCIVVEFIQGESKFEPADVADFVRVLATHLARIHSLDYGDLDLSFLPRQAERFVATLASRLAETDTDLTERRIWQILESAWPLPQSSAPALLHGDFWPGNLLWSDGKLAAIIDWEDAAIGDPLADLANSRLEILWALGEDAMDGFTQHYRTLMPTVDFTILLYHDLYVAARVAPKLSGWGLDEAEERAMRDSLHLFIGRASEALEG